METYGDGDGMGWDGMGWETSSAGVGWNGKLLVLGWDGIWHVIKIAGMVMRLSGGVTKYVQ